MAPEHVALAGPPCLLLAPVAVAVAVVALPLWGVALALCGAAWLVAAALGWLLPGGAGARMRRARDACRGALHALTHPIEAWARRRR